MTMQIPEDPMMLMSFINMKLRDDYDSLTALCEDLGLSQEDLVRKLADAGFEYNPSANKFW